MIGWRLCRRPFADLSGDGARLYGGRWNSPGRAVVYLADHPALAALEVRVHLDLPFELLPADYVLIQVSVPDAAATLDAPDVTGEAAAPNGSTVIAGDAWVAEASSATARVASVLVTHAWNILLNPGHPEARRAKVVGIEAFRFDPRLWRPLAGEG